MRRRRTVAAGLAALALAAGIAVSGVATSHARTNFAIRVVPGVELAQVVTAHAPPTTAACRTDSGGRNACYDPAQLRVAYGLAPLYAKGIEGQRQTIVIVDAFGSPTITADLKAFDAEFGIPAPPSFKIIHPEGAIPAYAPLATHRYGWATETSLDVEWSHALAPKANILLVETPTDEVEGTSGFPDIMAAERYVIAHRLGTVISQSFAATEQTFTSVNQLAPFRTAFTQAARARVSVLAGSGDLGATDYETNVPMIYPKRVTSWPSSDPLVTAVGGTRLDLANNGKALHPAVAWNDTYEYPSPTPQASGGGVSEFFARPAYQSSVAAQAGHDRAVPDVSMSAACSGFVDVYVGVAGPGAVPGWGEGCGTSEATPEFAAIVALADQEAGHGLGQLNPSLYALANVAHSGLVPVTSGNNTVSFRQGGSTVTVTGYQARDGYNLVTGLGTINAALFVPALVKEWKALNR